MLHSTGHPRGFCRRTLIGVRMRETSLCSSASDTQLSTEAGNRRSSQLLFFRLIGPRTSDASARHRGAVVFNTNPYLMTYYSRTASADV